MRDLEVRERISTLFSVRITAVTESADLDFETIVGQPARLEVKGDLAGMRRTRVWTGVCKVSHPRRVS